VNTLEVIFFGSIIMKFCQMIGFMDISDEFENSCDQGKNMVASGW
jgi:hypothetical protein